MQLLLDAQEALLVVLEHAADGDAGHLADQLGDVALVDRVAAGVFSVPVVAAGADLVLDGEQFLLDPRGGLVVLALGGGFLLLLELVDPASQLDHAGGRRLVVDHEPGGGFVDQVDRLVGQVALGQVALGESDGGLDGRFADLDAVVRLVARFEGGEDLDRVVGRGFVEVDGGEATFEGGVLLDVAAVLVEGGRADDAQFAPGEGRLEHVGGVDRAFGGARADDGVELVDEEDDLALGLADLVDDGLEPFLELAAELGSGEEDAHVERHESLAAQVVGHVVGGHALGEGLGDGGLADAGFADDHRVVLGPAVEDLEHAADFDVAADDGVEFALGGETGDVGGVAVEGVVVRLGVGLVDAAGAADLLEGAVESLGGDAVGADDLRGGAAGVSGQRDQQVLDADVFVVEALGLDVGSLEQLDDSGRDGELDHVVAEFGGGVDGGVGVGAESGAVDVEGVEQVVGQSVLDAGDAGEQVLDVPLGVALLAHELLRGLEQLLGLDGESVSSHHRRRSVRGPSGWTAGSCWSRTRWSSSLELSVLEFEFVDLLSHADDDVGAGEVDAEFVDQAADQEQAFDVVLAVEALPAGGPRGDEQALALVGAEGLLVDADELGGDADGVDGLVGHWSWSSRSRSCWKRSVCSGVSWSGSLSETSARMSPRPSRLKRGMPCPPSRKMRPFWVPGGIVRARPPLPLSERTTASPPSAAMVTGHRRRRGRRRRGARRRGRRRRGRSGTGRRGKPGRGRGSLRPCRRS